MFLKNLKEWLVCFIFMEAYLICDYLFLVYERNQNFKRIDKKLFIDIEYLIQLTDNSSTKENTIKYISFQQEWLKRNVLFLN